MNLDKYIEAVKVFEGYRKKPYRCTADKLTVGYGRNLDDVGIREEEAEYLLRKDVDIATKECLEYLENAGITIDNADRRYVLVDMFFNMGVNKVSQFKKMFLALKESDYGLAAEEMKDSKWYKQTGNRAEKLVEVMRSGKWIS